MYYFNEDAHRFTDAFNSGTGAQAAHLASAQKSAAWADFGSANYALSDAFTVRGGLRYTNDEKDFITVFAVNVVQIGPNSVKLSKNKVNWDLSGTYKLNKDFNLCRVQRQADDRSGPASGLHLEQRQIGSGRVRPQHHRHPPHHRRDRLQQPDRLRQRAAHGGRPVQGNFQAGDSPRGMECSMPAGRCNIEPKSREQSRLFGVFAGRSYPRWVSTALFNIKMVSVRFGEVWFLPNKL